MKTSTRSRKRAKQRALTFRERRALSLALAYDSLKRMRARGLGYPTLSTWMLMVIQMEAEDRGQNMDTTPEGALSVARIETIDELTALARATLDETQRAIIAAEACASLEELFASPEAQS